MGDCPPPVVGDLPGAWCAVNPGVGGLRACGTYDGLVYYTLPGSSVIALYDTDGGMLTALLAPENGELACVAGPAQLAIRASCRTAPDANVFAGFPGPGMGGCMRGLSDAGVVSD